MKSIKKETKRIKGDNLALCVIVIVLITVALLVGVSYGYKKGVSISEQHFNEYIDKYCFCIDKNVGYSFDRPTPNFNSTIS